MSFTDQKRRIVTEDDLTAPWGGYRDGRNFRCYLCGYRFKVGDGWRWVASGGASFEVDSKRFGCINFKVCDACDGDDVRERWAQRYVEFYGDDRFWALREHP